MTNKEAFELFVKYGGEGSIVKIQDMIHTAGVEVAKANTIAVFKMRHPGYFKMDEFVTFLCQGIDYINEQMQLNVQ